jgi:hypothetical protein
MLALDVKYNGNAKYNELFDGACRILCHEYNVSRGDAQGIVEVQGEIFEASLLANKSPKETALEIIKKSKS